MTSIERARDVGDDDDDDLPNHFVKQELEQMLERKFPNEIYNYSLSKATNKGENYIGIIYRVQVKFKQKFIPEFSFILKIPPKNPERREEFFVRPSFLREALAYEKFLPLVAKLQKSHANNTNNNYFTEYPKCYLVLTSENNEAIFLEDLSIKGFVLFNCYDEIMDLQHVQHVVRSFAKLHAASFVLKDQQPQEFEVFQHMPDWFQQRQQNRHFRPYFESLKISTLNCLDKETDQKYINSLTMFFETGEFYDLLLAKLSSDTSDAHAVVCHGDCWNNNFLFKYKNEEIVDVRLIDWQLMRYAAPVTDLMYFIFTCTTKNFRDQYYQQTLDYYYQQLSISITNQGSDCSKLYPLVVFERQLKSKGAIGLLFAMFILPITLQKLDSSQLKELRNAIQQDSIPENKDEKLKQRLRDVVIDTVDFGFISNHL